MTKEQHNAVGKPPVELPSELASDADILHSWASKRPFIRRLYLYGSRLKGTHRPDSDLDVAVEFDPVGTDRDCFTTWICEAKHWRNQLQPLLSAPLHLEWHDPSGETAHVTQGLQDAAYVVFERHIESRE